MEPRCWVSVVYDCGEEGLNPATTENPEVLALAKRVLLEDVEVRLAISREVDPIIAILGRCRSEPAPSRPGQAYPGGGRGGSSMTYTVVIKGGPPPDLAHKVAEAHARAILQASAQKRAARGAKAQAQV